MMPHESAAKASYFWDVTSTLLVLFVIPCLYCILEGFGVVEMQVEGVEADA